ncbi:MAG: glycosyltransferase family 4 protein [Elusimicrobia bacterium]|nr:glycosyltransferase family 4 protein [Elusimicrobiota bacterium]
MKIVIEEPLHGSGRGGVSVYSKRMAALVSKMDPANEYFLFTYYFGRHSDVEARVAPPPGAAYRRLHARWPERLVRKAEWGWGLPVLEGWLKAKGAALYHAHRIPITAKVPLVTTVYDLFTVVHPEWNSPWMIDLFERIVRPGLARVERIMAISTHTKRDLIERWGIPEERIETILWGVDRALFRPLPAPDLAAVRSQYRLPERFMLLVGPFDPWCDPQPSIEALARLPSHLSDVSLVLAGPRGSCYEDACRKAEALGLSRRLRWLGHVPQSDLVSVYNLAQGLLFASRYEGFGLPVLEGMACGTPVVTSTTSALPEVAGGAALLCDPDSPEQLAAAMVSILDDGAVRADLREKGLRRAAALPWEETARRTLAVYKGALGR